jgi:hypothetical protein
MPIRRELRHYYPPNWPELSRRVRFEHAGEACQVCGRPHGLVCTTCRDPLRLFRKSPLELFQDVLFGNRHLPAHA